MGKRLTVPKLSLLAMAAVLLVSTSLLTACRPSKHVLVIGDSLTVGAVSAGLGDDGLDTWVVSAKIGRSTNAAINIAANRNIAAYDLVIIAVGTNDYGDSKANYALKVDNMMATLGPEADVLWVNVDTGATRLGPARYGVNPAIADGAARHANLRVADWDAYTRSVSNMADFRAGDGIHYNPSGYGLRANWIERLPGTT